MKKLFIITVFLLFVSAKSINAQNPIEGYYTRLDSKIWINGDSTFRFFYSVDTDRKWCKGRWVLKGKRIFFKMIPVYDTLVISSDSLNPKDSLVLSRDEKPEKINVDPCKSGCIFKVEQNEELCPKKMYYKKDRLYVLKNNKKLKKKIDNGYYIEPFEPWYTRSKSN